MEKSVPSFPDIADAAQRLKGYARRTPVLTSKTFDDLTGMSVYFKAENFQKVGAFKFRGAANAILNLSQAQSERPVLAYSSGNHGQAIACAARDAGIPAIIVMPSDAPAMKLAATKSYGAEIITYDRLREKREELSQRIAEERDATLIPPVDHPDIIAGQGTAALELLEDVGHLDAIFVPVGGGGLASGTAIVSSALSPNCQVFGVEPATGDDAKRSLEAGHIVQIEVPRTIADGVQTNSVEETTFHIMRSHLHEIVTVDDDALVAAMRFLAERMKIIVEPSGCLGVAAALQEAQKLKGKRVGIILSGGNVDIENFSRLMLRGSEPNHAKS